MKKINWLIVGIIGILALLFLFGGGMMSGWGFGNQGYRGWGMMGPGMMGWGYSPLGWIGMLFMWLIPIGVITLIVFGIAALVRNSGNPTLPSSQSTCPNCAKSVQADWQNCPHCGTALK
ncbi:MAG: zinc ribbon domain-containing protein [Anaerolineales bacterium]|nr:zinc ribbon domain-containing protein [Anaerolineales bacterium]